MSESNTVPKLLNRQFVIIFLIWPLLNIMFIFSALQFIGLSADNAVFKRALPQATITFFSISWLFGIFTIAHQQSNLTCYRSLGSKLLLNSLFLTTAILLSLLIFGKVGYNSLNNIESLLRRIVNASNLFLQMFFFTVLTHSWELKKQAIELSLALKQSEIDLLRTQTNPHFLFNTLNLIVGEVQPNPKLARELIFELSDLLRATITLSGKKDIQLKDELNIIKHYLFLQRSRFKKRLDVDIQIDDHLLEKRLPPMMLLTLVENVVKHAVAHTTECIYIRISGKETTDMVSINVLNNWPYMTPPVFVFGSGLSNLRDGLRLYEPRAVFAITHKEGIVEASINLPRSSI